MCIDDEKNKQTTETKKLDNAETQSENPEEQAPLKPSILPFDEFLNFDINIEKINVEVKEKQTDDSDDD